MVKIGSIYNMGDFFMPHMLEHVSTIVDSYGAGFGVVGFTGSDLKSYLLWLIDHIVDGVYPACGLYIKEAYVDYYVPSDNIWLNMWRLAMHSSPIGLGGEVVLFPYVGKYPFYVLSILNEIEEIMRSSNITDINVLSILEKKLFESKIKVIIGMSKEEIARIDWLVCRLYADEMMSSLSGGMRRRFKSAVREVCNDKF